MLQCLDILRYVIQYCVCCMSYVIRVYSNTTCHIYSCYVHRSHTPALATAPSSRLAELYPGCGIREIHSVTCSNSILCCQIWNWSSQQLDYILWVTSKYNLNHQFSFATFLSCTIWKPNQSLAWNQPMGLEKNGCTPRWSRVHGPWSLGKKVQNLWKCLENQLLWFVILGANQRLYSFPPLPSALQASNSTEEKTKAKYTVIRYDYDYDHEIIINWKTWDNNLLLPQFADPSAWLASSLLEACGTPDMGWHSMIFT